jgi:hypothetical protein
MRAGPHARTLSLSQFHSSQLTWFIWTQTLWYKNFQLHSILNKYTYSIGTRHEMLHRFDVRIISQRLT